MDTILTVNPKKLQKEVNLRGKVNIWDSFFLTKDERGAKSEMKKGWELEKNVLKIRTNQAKKTVKSLKGVKFGQGQKGNFFNNNNKTMFFP